jgi:RNA polymerase sigma factor (sigma-70 family)
MADPQSPGVIRAGCPLAAVAACRGRMEPAASTSPSGLVLLFAELRAELVRFLAARTGSPADAEDLAQELWLRIQGVQPGPIGNGRAYLYRAAQNLVLDQVRERRRREAREAHWHAAAAASADGEVIDSGPDALDAMIERERDVALARAIEGLPEGAGRVFRLHKLEGLSHSDIAARLGISRSGVEKHVAVAMAHLRRAMGTEV